jgi:hypothetical protein
MTRGPMMSATWYFDGNFAQGKKSARSQLTSPRCHAPKWEMTAPTHLFTEPNKFSPSYRRFFFRLSHRKRLFLLWFTPQIPGLKLAAAGAGGGRPQVRPLSAEVIPRWDFGRCRASWPLCTGRDRRGAAERERAIVFVSSLFVSNPSFAWTNFPKSSSGPGTFLGSNYKKSNSCLYIQLLANFFTIYIFLKRISLPYRFPLN